MTFVFGACEHPIRGPEGKYVHPAFRCRVCWLLELPWWWEMPSTAHARDDAHEEYGNNQREANKYVDLRPGWPLHHHERRTCSDTYMDSKERQERRRQLPEAHEGARSIQNALIVARGSGKPRILENHYCPHTGEPARAYLHELSESDDD